jgi:predicted ABC-type ATPase
MKSRNVYIIAGPNGAGKTSFAVKFLPAYAKCSNFINADLIAAGLSPFSPRTVALKAGKLVLEQIHRFAAKGIDFAFETTLSGKLYVNLLKSLKAKGYRIHLFFLWIPSSGLAISRIKNRVAEGGHDVPAEDVIRRFNRSIANFFRLYQPLSDSWLLFNNAESNPILIAQMKSGRMTLMDKDLYNSITENIGGI